MNISDIRLKECGVYNIINTTANTESYVIKELTYTSMFDYKLELVAELTILAGDNTDIPLLNSGVYIVYAMSDPTIQITIVEACRIEKCIMGYINKLVCCDDCLACDETCKGTEWLAKFNATSLMYVLFKDLIKAVYQGETIFYFEEIQAFSELHTINELLEKMEELCGCTNC